MSLLNFPPEILYDILGEVVASYIERAITSPPIGGWETMDSEGHSEWYTDDGDSADEDDMGIDSSDDGSDVDDSSDQDVINDYDLDSDEDDISLSDASADDEHSDTDELDASLSMHPTSENTVEDSVQRLENIVQRLENSVQRIIDEREHTTAETSSVVAGEAANIYSDSEVPNDSLSLWALEQERRFADSDDILAYKLFLWDTIERKEKLPTNDIASLLSVCHSAREITLKLVSDALGFDNNAKESTEYNPWYLLRLLRRHYRIAHTQPFDLSEQEYPARMTPLVQCYYWLSDLSYSLRHLGRLVSEDTLAGFGTVYDMLSLISMAEDIPQLVFRSRIARRAHIFLVHLRRYISVSMYCEEINKSYKEMFSLTGTARRPRFIIHEDKIPNFVKAIQTFAKFDRKHMDRKRYPELPGPLVNLSGVARVLSDVKKLKYVSEFRRQPDIMAATTDAIDLMEKWKRRADLSSYIVIEN